MCDDQRLLPLESLGAREAEPNIIDFGIYLPGTSTDDGYKLYVKIIHEDDQFIQGIPPLSFPMDLEAVPGHETRYGDSWYFWHGRVDINNPQNAENYNEFEKAKNNPELKKAPAWGEPGKYVYRYQLDGGVLARPIDFIIDPFAREFGIGKLSSITIGYKDYGWSPEENKWRTPGLEDLIVYEMMINEFGGSLEGATQRLSYLEDLGINCLEVMPISNVSETVDWGFHPLGYFGVDERFGNTPNMQKFIDMAHGRGIAVILDVVYAHVDSSFPYAYLYRELEAQGRKLENPFVGSFAKDEYGESTNFNKQFVQDFFYTVNYRLLNTYHVDGFRYDYVPGYWDGPVGIGYAKLVYDTYCLVKGMRGEGGHWQRFFDQGSINLIQCAEQLECPAEIIDKTYSNCTWQNEMLNAAKSAARSAIEGKYGDLYQLGLATGLSGFNIPGEGEMKKTAFQYTENHDHTRFICNFGTTPSEIMGPLEELKKNTEELCNRDLKGPGMKLADYITVLKDGDLNNWFKVQPYLIAMFASKGVPMLWQGQEFGENYYVPDKGWGRVKLFRPVRWDYFYTDKGRTIANLIRKLIKIRRNRPQLRYGEHYFYNDYDRYQSRGVLLFHRRIGDSFSLVGLNFTDSNQEVSFAFPVGGSYHEDLDMKDMNVTAGEETHLTINGNYGCIWTREA